PKPAPKTPPPTSAPPPPNVGPLPSIYALRSEPPLLRAAPPFRQIPPVLLDRLPIDKCSSPNALNRAVNLAGAKFTSQDQVFAQHSRLRVEFDLGGKCLR